MNIEYGSSGRVRGQYHPHATLTDQDVELMRQLHDAGWGYRRLPAKFEAPRSTVQRICTYRNR